MSLVKCLSIIQPKTQSLLTFPICRTPPRDNCPKTKIIQTITACRQFPLHFQWQTEIHFFSTDCVWWDTYWWRAVETGGLWTNLEALRSDCFVNDFFATLYTVWKALDVCLSSSFGETDSSAPRTCDLWEGNDYCDIDVGALQENTGRVTGKQQRPASLLR